MTRSFAAGAAVAGLLATMAVLPATAVPSGIEFGACPDYLTEIAPTMVCGNLDVPLDYRHPNGRKLSLFVSKVPARDPAKRRGSLFVNPGGPGGPGPALAAVVSSVSGTGYTRMPGAVLDAYDLIGVDVRGNPFSEPVHCVAPDYFTAAMPDPDKPQSRAALWRFWNGFADGCGATSGDVLKFMGTTSVARDFDQVRAALGERKFDYWGVSYGTWIGAVYGKLFPQRVGRMILDGNVDPTPKQLWYELTKAQDLPVQKRLETFFAWAARYDSVFHLGTTAGQVRKAWNTTLASWRRTPHGQVGGYELTGAAYGIAFSESGWIPFAQVLSSYVVDGDDSGLVEFAAPYLGEDNEQANAIYASVICVDSPWPRSRATYERETAKLASKGAQTAWYNMWTSGAACQDWPVPSEERPKITGAGLPPILMFNSVGDAATPYAGALRMHHSLPSSILVTERNAGKHGVFANSELLANPQANAIGARYLLQGVLPPHDTSVPGHPYPNPTTSTAVTTRSRPLTPTYN